MSAGERRLDTREVDVPRLLLALAIPYERAGSQLKALCPYHEDSKPSWAIRDLPGDHKNGHHRCLSCGEGGSVVALVMRSIDLSYGGAVEWLLGAGLVAQAAIEGLELRFDDPLARLAPAEVRMPAGVRFSPLERWPSVARKYALEDRHLTPEQVERWGIGYAVDGELEGRLVFPVRDCVGSLRSYEARSYYSKREDSIRKRPKYLRPSLRQGYRFGAIFGAERWAESDGSAVVVTEGVLNALACERAGAPAVAAICGSVLSNEHVLELKPRFERIIVATDPDKAGTRVAAELAASLARWSAVGFAELPPGKDCDDLARDDLAYRLAELL